MDVAIALEQASATVVGNDVEGDEAVSAAAEEIRRARTAVIVHKVENLADHQAGIMFGRRIRYDGTHVELSVAEGDWEAHRRLKDKVDRIVSKAGTQPMLRDGSLLPASDMLIDAAVHRAGAECFDGNRASSARKPDCEAHELDDVYIADVSCSSSSGMICPSLTGTADALRLADPIKEHLG